MEDKINSIKMNGKLDHEELYDLFKTNSSRINKKISEKIDDFKNNIDFFGFYSNKDIKNLLNIFELKLPKNYDEYFSSFKTDTEQYISCISHIILSIKLFLKMHDILTKIVINAKNFLSKLKNENKLENYNHDLLFLYFESLLKFPEKNYKSNNSRASTLLSSNISSYLDTPKNSLFSRCSNEYKIEDFSISEVESIKFDNQHQLTPRFESESNEEFGKQEKKNSNLKNSIENNFLINQESVLTLSKYVFVEEPFTPKNYESKLIESPITKTKKKDSSTQKIPQTENINKYKHKKKISYDKYNNKNYYRNLLEMISKMYKKGLINTEEKIKLKQLVINKSKKIKCFYYNIYLNTNNNKNILINEVKKIVN